MTREIAVCPECDTSDISPRAPSLSQSDLRKRNPAASYRCNACGAVFDEPATRRRQADSSSVNGPAKLLEDADGSVVGDD